MARTINVNLTPRQIHEICNALNAEAQRLDAVDAERKRPGHSVREAGAKWNRAMTRILAEACGDDKRNPAIPVCLPHTPQDVM